MLQASPTLDSNESCERAENGETAGAERSQAAASAIPLGIVLRHPGQSRKKVPPSGLLPSKSSSLSLRLRLEIDPVLGLDLAHLFGVEAVHDPAPRVPHKPGL